MIEILADHGGVHLDAGFWITAAIIFAGAVGAGIARFLDKSNWRDVAESRGAEIDDLKDKQDELEGRVAYLEAQIEGLVALKSEQIAHLVLEGLQDHRGD